MNPIKHPTESRNFYAADREPSPDLGVRLWHITGLDNFSIPRPASLARNAKQGPQATGSDRRTILGSDMREATTAALHSREMDSRWTVEFAGYNVNDVTTYFTNVKQPLTVAVTGVSTDGSSLSCTGGCDDTEQVLDIEVAISMAPGMSNVYVYVSDTAMSAILQQNGDR